MKYPFISIVELSYNEFNYDFKGFGLLTTLSEKKEISDEI